MHNKKTAESLRRRFGIRTCPPLLLSLRLYTPGRRESKENQGCILTIPSHSFTHPLLKNSSDFQQKTTKNQQNQPHFQSKTLTVKNKNINFQNFLSPFFIMAYEHQAKKNS
jgi:hypothetical protein